MRCSYCHKPILAGSRYYLGRAGGWYHISCGASIGLVKKQIKYALHRKRRK